MDSWVDGYWFLVLVPEYWFPGIGSRVPYPVTQNACTIHSSPRKPCQNEEIQVWHKKCTECIQMIVFHDSFGEPSKPPNHASNDPNYYTFPIGLAQKSIHNAIQGDNCVLETTVRKPLCYDTMIQNIILPQISSAQKSNS